MLGDIIYNNCVCVQQTKHTKLLFHLGQLVTVVKGEVVQLSKTV